MSEPSSVPKDADDALHNLTDQEWRVAHEAQYGDGSAIPDSQLSYVHEPGQSVEDLGGEDAVRARLR